MNKAWARALAERTALAEQLRARLGLGEWVDAWCRSTATGAVSSKNVDPDTLAKLAGQGCRIEIAVEIDRLRVHAIAEGSRQFTMESSGEWSDAATDESAATDAAEGASRNDLARVLKALPAITITLRITVIGKAAGTAWVRTPHAFVTEFERTGWYGFAELLKPEPGVSNHVVVVDADSQFVRAAGLAVHGPEVWTELPPWSAPAEAMARDDARSRVPAPIALMPQELNGNKLEDVAATLESVAGTVAWLRLADVAMVDGPEVSVRFVGNKPVTGVLPPCPPDVASASVELWTWVTTGAGEPGRRHAASQAVSLQADEPGEVFDRASSIRDTAEFLFSVSQSGLVQEALAARRAARNAAVAAGRSAADRARAAARSAVDRALVVVGGAVGVVLANKGELIDSAVALGLIALAATIAAGAAVMAFHLELPGAARVVEVFRTELKQHAEVLSSRDVEAIRALPSLTDGNTEVKRARTATIVIVVVAFMALTGLAASVTVELQAIDGPGTRSTPSTTPAPTEQPQG